MCQFLLCRLGDKVFMANRSPQPPRAPRMEPFLAKILP